MSTGRRRVRTAAVALGLGAVGLGPAPAWGQTSTQTLAPASVAFGSVAVGTQSPAQTLTFTTTATVTIDTVGASAPFQVVAGGTCGPGVVVVAGGSGCTLRIAFEPTTEGSATGVAGVDYSGSLFRQSTLSGTGAPAPTTSTSSSTTTTAPEVTTTAAPTTTTRTVPPTTQTTAARATTSTSATSTTEPTTTTEAPAGTTTTTTSTTLAPSTGPTASTPGRGVSLDATTAQGGRSGPPGIGLTVVGSGYPARGGRATGAPGRLGSGEAALPAHAQPAPACPTVYFALDGQRFGATHPDAAGQVRKRGVWVPGGTDPGRHDITSSCAASGRPVLAAASFEVTDVEVHRSALATALPQVDQVSFAVDGLVLSALAVAGLLVLIAFPAELFNTTLEEHYDEVRGWFGLKPRSLGGGRHHALLLIAFLAVSGPLWFAMQPTSHLDQATAYGALGLSLATGFVVVASDIPATVHVRRRYGERARAVALPGALLVAVACVALSRAVHFQPGYFYGLVGGLALSRSLEREVSGRIATRTVAGLLLLSVASWVALRPVSAAAAETGRTLGIIMVENVLGGIFWTALDSLVIGMLPLRLLEGAKIAAWSRVRWAVLYGLTLLAFVHILLRPSSGYVSNTSVSPPNVVVGMFVGFAILSFAFWGYFRFRRPRSGAEALADEVEGATGPVPGDVLLAEGVGAVEIERGAVGPVDPTGHGLVWGQPREPEDGDPV